MISLGIVSDSHGDRINLERAAVVLEGCGALVHLGDLASDAKWLAARTGKHVYSVRGNCDGLGNGESAEMMVTIEGMKMLLTHGHRLGVKNGLTRLFMRAREAGVCIALYGHTHMPSVECDGGVMLVNPGALMEGRYAVLELRENGPVPAMKIL